ncbi:hypothetical protein YK48G_00830 [Lentilactobacillus fungorum]|uniref:DUF1027 domain-containing protein n=1 Tax=Lentilactobacillus fungorum TaxID=2201250 RepID=A0ABQ3VVJ7_9LACO|nr:YutD family protein [Lentilactobacillus fungorum]GHP12658.1 hypothetical protein YK48G_00830 [Lentilactobacillus fungorum]
MDRKQLEELVDQKNEMQKPLARITRVSESELLINDHKYELVDDHEKGFDFDAFVARYNPALSQFDYIIGDWGYGQLRLRGFFNDDRDVHGGPFISDLNDYILEFVNLGAPYFVIHNLEARPIIRKSRNLRSRRHTSKNHSRNTHHSRRNHSFTEQKVSNQKRSAPKRQKMVVKAEEKSHNHHFIIRESKK